MGAPVQRSNEAHSAAARSPDGALARALWIGLALLPALALNLASWSRGPGLLDDDYAQYLMHAQALLEGRAYTDIAYIYTDLNRFVGPRAEPPGLVWTLYPVLALASPGPGTLKLLMLVSLLAFVALAGLYFARVDRLVSLGVTALCAIALHLEQATTSLMADPGFCALVWAVVYLADAPGRWNPRRLALMSAAGSAALAYRLAGVALIPAMALLFWLRRREQGPRPLIPLAAWSITFLLLTVLLPTSEAVQQELLVQLWSLPRTVAFNLWQYRQAVFASHLYPFPGDRSNDVYHLLTVALMALGWMAWKPSPRAFVVLFAGAYVAMVLITPAAVTRYLWPLYPLFVFGLLNGARVTARRLWPHWPARRAAVALAGVFALTAAMAVAKAEGVPRAAGLKQRADAQELFDFLARRARRETVRVVFCKPRTLGWETGVPAMPLFIAPADAALEELRSKGITHVIVDDLGVAPRRAEALQQLVQSRPDRFHLEFRTGAFTVYRFYPGP